MAVNLTYINNRESFNQYIQFFRQSKAILADINRGKSGAAILRDAARRYSMNEQALLAVINTLFIDKFGYTVSSHNLKCDITGLDKRVEVYLHFDYIDFFFVHHATGTLKVIDPLALGGTTSGLFYRGDLVVTYSAFRAGADRKGEFSLTEFNEFAVGVLYGTHRSGFKAVRDTIKEAHKVSRVPQASDTGYEEITSEPVQVSPAGKSIQLKKSSLISVQVSNELFHNGNVEAWVKIIDSYESIYPGCEVHVYYDNEPVNNLNSLFKWGKVTNGSVIMISVTGPELKDLGKLQRTLYLGASPRFEQFISGPVHKKLRLF